MEVQEVKAKLLKAYELILTPKYALPILIAIASAIRLLPMRFKYLLGYDPYFHLAYIRYALEKGEWVNFFPYATGPWGFQIHHFHPLGLWMTPAYVYKFLSVFGVSLYNSFRITPVIFGVLTVVFTYLVMLKLYGKKEAFLSAFFLAVLFGHVFRSMAGYYRGDNYMLFWYSVALFGIALALSKKSEEWRYKRLVFYLIPALASGFSAIFWQAYYPIFGFLLGSALFLAVGAFLLERKREFIDAIMLVIATIVGAILANAFGGRFGYGMVGETEWLGQKFAEEFGLQFGFIKDAFLLVYLKYAVPSSIVAIILLFILSRFIKETKQKAIIVGIGVIIFFWIGIKYYGRIDNLVKELFPTWEIVETQRTTLNDLWKAYGIAIFITPAFFLTFLPRKTTIRDFVLLGLALIAIPMVILWTRFLFIGSLAVAVMAGIGLMRAYEMTSPKVESKKFGTVVLTIILLSIPLTTAFQGFWTTKGIRPITNEGWDNALTYLGEHSNINDIVLTWWDQGHWVTYFAGRAPVAQGGVSKWVAQYYLGIKTNKDLMNLGVDYVIVSYDTIMKFEAVLETADASPREYAMVPMPLVSSMGGMLLFSAGPYSIMAVPKEGSWSVQVNTGGAILIPREVFVERGKSVENVTLTGKPNADAYVYLNLNYGYAVLMNGKAFETPLAKLMFTNDHPNFTEVYSDGGYIKIFRFEHPNVVVTSENGSVLLRFTNNTGTGIGIYGYLDNGTLLFKKWYGVKGKEEFVLPVDINGSVVIRYIYTQRRAVLDRGVFRISDVLSGTGSGG
ncbi:STT3 domain-containing protein [Thermococcus radiotolerans]|uniref:dolichyl-phosphooligosaccharide-protein glycotransferase n=1 Tax=Thermococcus radiotolerans TaxID=187880 RepID=A0A2Z2NCG9_9EURY|nr:STT3 domain-containing protein [Thermococcus radiotolerans]ASJ15386.1 oligosaccharyl transferase, STT3 subunit [Thermococcus radiotolerans]